MEDMNSTAIPTKHRGRTFLALGLAALVSASLAPAQTAAASSSGGSSDVQQLQAENAALRAKIAELEGQQAAAQQQPAATPVAQAAPATATNAAVTPAAGTSKNGVVTLSPFSVNSEKSYGYLQTNATTATRIGMEIQKIPMSVTVLDSSFIQDANLRDFNDVLKYVSSASGDPRFDITRPSNEATPQGGMTLRGFPINIILRNGVLLYSTKTNVDNIDRIEIVKGPAAVFFGQGYPGGVVNYITKRPEFGRNFTTITHSVGGYTTGTNGNKENRLVMDTNEVLSDHAALRIVGGWENSNGPSEFSYEKRFDITPSITLVPFKDPKLLSITAEAIYLKERFNQNDYAWFFPSGWFQAYANPTAALMTAAGMDPNDPASIGKYRTRIFNSLGNWAADMRKATNDPTMPIYTHVARGAYYTNTAGVRVHDENFNFMNRGAYSDNEQTTTDFTVESSPTDWLSFKYVYTADNTTFTDREGLNYPNADGYTFNAALSGNGAGYYRKTKNHQLDVIFTLPEFFGIKNKILAGYVYQKYLQQYATTVNGGSPVYYLVPGYNYPGNPPPTYVVGPGANNNSPAGSYLRDRYGNIMTAQQVYSMWDPSVQVQPPVDKLYPFFSNPLDGYPTQYNDWYVNWQASALNDRLTLLAGFRQETRRDSGQALTANFPWFSPPPYAGLDQTTYPPSMYNYSPSYALSNFDKVTGNSGMAGASYAITKDINLYASVSSTFRFNYGTMLGGFLNKLDVNDPDFQAMVNPLLAAGNGSFTYTFADGSTRTITNIAQALQAVNDDGASIRAKDEKGINYEVGLKANLNDSKLVGTWSLFQLDRTNQLTEDFQHQSGSVDIFNYNPLNGNRRYFRWRSNAAHNRIRGTEVEVIWTPNRNFQSMTNLSWLWMAKTLADPSVPKTAGNYAIYFGNRIENVPEWRFNSFNKYTLTDTFLRGMYFGLGANYASKEIISRSVDWNPDQGGFTAGNYITFDGMIGYPWELFGYQLKSQLGVYNVLDSKYFDGGYVPGPRRNIMLTTTMSF